MAPVVRRAGFTLIDLLVVSVILAAVTAILVPVFIQARQRAAVATCMSNQRQIAMYALQFAQDHDGDLPPAATCWQDLQAPARLLRCPAASRALANAYVINSAVTGQDLESFAIPSEVALIIDGAHDGSTADGNCDNVAYLPQDLQARHNGHYIVGFLDGHIQLTDQVPALVKLPEWDNLSLWYTADNGVDDDARGAVSGWADHSSHRAHASTADDASLPRCVASVPSLGGNPAILFEPPDSDAYLIVSQAISDYWGSNEGTIFIVFQPLGHNDNYEFTIFDQMNGDTDQATRARVKDDATASIGMPIFAAASDDKDKDKDKDKDTGKKKSVGQISWFRKTAAQCYPPDNVTYDAPALWTVVSSSTSYTAYNNGVAWPAYAGGPDWQQPNSFYIGGSPHGANAHRRRFDGYIAEVIVYQRALPDDERRHIEQYLLKKYQLP